MESQSPGCFCRSCDVWEIGSRICPYLCPWMPLTAEMKIEREEKLKKKGHQEKIVEELEDIRKQKTDKCTYKFVMLKNGIKVLLIEDPSATTSACSLEIKVGNFADPPHLPGLAHLLEHLILSGSELFPAEGFSAFLSARGGSNNAYTASSYTNFHFDIHKDHFLDSLDRFVSYFICPVFHEKTIQSEVEIIQCEHEKNKQSDVWRTNQVEKCTANFKHPFSRFSTGTRRTLQVDPKQNKNLKYEVFTFFKRYYSANLMSVCILHNADINKLEEIAMEKFILIPNKNIPQTIYRAPVFRPDQMGLKLFIVPIREIYHLNLTFPLPDYNEFYSASPGSLVSYLLRHKGEGSVYSLLRREGLAHHVVATHKRFDLADFSFMLITIQLTDLGERHVDAIIQVVFQYIQLLKNSSPLKNIFDELCILSEQQFQMKEREMTVNLVESLAHSLHQYQPQDVLTGEYVISDWRPELIDNLLAHIHPHNLRVTILSKNTKFLETKVEPHYGTEYHVDKIPEDVLSQWRSVSTHPDLRLPSPNVFISSSPSMVELEGGKVWRQPELILLLDRVHARAWCLTDTRFLIPKTFVHIAFRSPVCYTSPRNFNLNNLLVYCVKDSLVEYTYPALLAGMAYSMKPTKFGFELIIRGYNEKINLLIDSIVEAIYALKFTEDHFQTVLTVHRKGLVSCSSEPLRSQSKYLLNCLLSSRVWTREDRLRNLDDIALRHLVEFGQDFLENHHLEFLFYGNVTKSQARKISEQVISKRADFLEKRCELKEFKISMNPNLADWFKTDPVERLAAAQKAFNQNVPADQLASLNDGLSVDEDLLIPSGSNTVVINNEKHTMSMVVVFLQLNTTSLEKSCLLEVFAHLVRERIITRLRNLVILGYVIGCDIRKINRSTGLRIYVESQFPPSAVNVAIEDCIEELDSYLQSINHTNLKIHLNAMRAIKMESHMKMMDFSQTLWKEILEGSYDFRRHQRECEHLNFITLSKIRQFYKQYIKFDGEDRRKLVISIAPDPTLNTVQEENNTVYTWDDREVLKSRCIPITGVSHEELKLWLTTVFRCGDDGYQPPGEDPGQGQTSKQHPQNQLTVHFKSPDIEKVLEEHL